MRICVVLLIILASLFTMMRADASVRSDVKRGNRLYRQEQYAEALTQYSRALADKPDSPQIRNNMGLALYKTDRYEQARDMFLQALEDKTLTDQQKSILAFNLGNTLYQQQDYPKAIEMYRQAIDLDAQNMDARYNLQQANKKLLQQSQPNENNSPQGNKSKDKNREGDKQNREGNKQQDSQQEDKIRQEKEQGSRKEQKDPNSIPPEEAERLLDALAEDEDQHPLRQQQKIPGAVHVEKDW